MDTWLVVMVDNGEAAGCTSFSDEETARVFAEHCQSLECDADITFDVCPGPVSNSTFLLDMFGVTL